MVRVIDWRRVMLGVLVVMVCGVQLLTAYKLKRVTLPEDLSAVKVYTDEEMAKYDASNPNLPILMAVKGVVFDVTKGKDFYGKGMSYNALAGKDCTQAVAKVSLDPKHLNSNVETLTDNELNSLDEIFTSTYMPKYPVVGYMDYLVAREKQDRLGGKEL